MRCLPIVAILCALLLPQSSYAQALPSTLFSGSVQRSYTAAGGTNPRAWCSVDNGLSLVQRKSGDPGNLMFSLPPITLATFDPTSDAAPIYQTFSGQTVMGFTSSTAGIVNFRFAEGSVTKVPFSGYTQIYDGVAVLSVNFVMQFPNCTLKIAAKYRG